MADFRSTAIVKQDVKNVFDVLSSLEYVPKLIPYVTQVEKITDGPVGVGSKFIETRNVRGKEVKSELEIIEFNPYQSYTLESKTSGLGVVFHYEFSEIEEGTQIELTANLVIKGLMMKLTKPYLLKIVQREDGYQLQYLKELMDGDEAY